MISRRLALTGAAAAAGGLAVREPARAAGGDAMPPPDDPDREDVEAAVSVLASVAEVTALLAGTDLARRADAIELIERLLPDAHLTPARYRALLRAWPGAVHASLRAVHGSMRAPG